MFGINDKRVCMTELNVVMMNIEKGCKPTGLGLKSSYCAFQLVYVQARHHYNKDYLLTIGDNDMQQGDSIMIDLQTVAANI